MAKPLVDEAITMILARAVTLITRIFTMQLLSTHSGLFRPAIH
jgi:hypothetical protein